MACNGRAEALGNFKGQALRTLAIGVLQTVHTSLVPQMLERVRKAQPHLVVQIYELTGLEVERRLLNGSLDIGISYLPPRQPGLHGVMLYEDELTLVIPADHPLREFKKVSMSQAAELPMLLLGEEFQVRQIWQTQLASMGRRPQVQAELNNMAGILDSLPHTRLATVLPGRSQKAHGSKDLLWKPLSEPRVPLKIGLVCRDVQRQQASMALLRTLLEEVINRPDERLNTPPALDGLS